MVAVTESHMVAVTESHMVAAPASTDTLVS